MDGTLKTNFLKQAGWGEAQINPIAGDASFRQYARLQLGNKTAILMDSSQEKSSLKPFVQVQGYYNAQKYSVPQILAEDITNGFLLLEDFGDAVFAKILQASPAQEAELYNCAIDLLAAKLQDGISNYDLPYYNDELLEREVGLLVEWFLPAILPIEQVPTAAAEFMAAYNICRAPIDITPKILVHRDFHAENLYWLANCEGVGREGVKRVGMIDFQDAVLGSPAYDLVSLLEDARRDVAPETVQAGLERFLQTAGLDEKTFRREYAFYGMQRNAKILGIFNRLNVRDKKPRYLELLPRVWGHFMHDVQHEDMVSMKEWVEKWGINI